MGKILNKEKKPVVVYTALFGDYDFLIDPREAYDGYDFICFTDQENLKTEIWKIIKVEESFVSPITANRHFKWHPHLYFNDYEISLYLDSNIVLYKDPSEMIEKYLQQSDIAMPKHPFRNCLYEEAVACIKENKTTLNKLYRQMVYYKHSDYPKAAGLAEQGIIIRRHNRSNVKRVMELLWEELERWKNYRDQIAFPYVIWKSQEKISFMGENSRANREFIYIPHQEKERVLSFIERIFVAIRARRRRLVDVNLMKMVLRCIK